MRGGPGRAGTGVDGGAAGRGRRGVATLLLLVARLTPCSMRLCAVAETMVMMECDYVTPSFFRELEKEYQSGLRR